MKIYRQRIAKKRKRTRKPIAKLTLIALCMKDSRIMELYKAIRGLE